ncbi:MAG: ABC transporter ATP-binding protein [Candidatus Omnitrophica bacterium]|nr:ABC transporter ATP-binding protein [Candidatus Omnitrophota bacterium]MDD5352347.1 ABC transporter ATP-binding protein [Candidatus Omnitrophota bacterium]MDD5549945.1 ABC transporter ATP-binding protein [Candidatus Omnitrophota bacterium]
MNSNILLKASKLNTRIFYKDSVVNAVCDLDLELREKEILAIIGESGCGKTMSMLSLTNLLPQSAKITEGQILFNGKDIEMDNEDQLRKIRGAQISYVFQDATASLNPLFSVGEQIREMFITHEKIPSAESKNKVLEVLESVNLKPAEKYYSYYPHQLSGGMNQRAMIAMAIASKPKLLIADEPTSSLDRITEMQILNLLRDLNKKMNLSIIFITHNISIIENFADRIVIMYAGRIIEKGDAKEILRNPKHPYTKALLKCLPKKENKDKFLNTIEGNVADLSDLPDGCKFNPRCPYVMDVCLKEEPEFKKVSEGHFTKCYLE